jgi:hypothetical protein
VATAAFTAFSNYTHVTGTLLAISLKFVEVIKEKKKHRESK